MSECLNACVCVCYVREREFASVRVFKCVCMCVLCVCVRESLRESECLNACALQATTTSQQSGVQTILFSKQKDTL